MAEHAQAANSDYASIARANDLQAPASTIHAGASMIPSQNAALLPNNPAVHQDILLQDILAFVNLLNTRIESLERKVEETQRDLVYESQCSMLRVLNARQANNGPLRAIPSRPGCPPYQEGDFPPTFIDFCNLTAPSLDRLLSAFGLPIEGTVEENQTKLAPLLGRIF